MFNTEVTVEANFKQNTENDPPTPSNNENLADLRNLPDHDIYGETITATNSIKSEKYDIENSGLEPIEKISTSRHYNNAYKYTMVYSYTIFQLFRSDYHKYF